MAQSLSAGLGGVEGPGGGAGEGTGGGGGRPGGGSGGTGMATAKPLDSAARKISLAANKETNAMASSGFIGGLYQGTSSFGIEGTVVGGCINRMGTVF